MIVSHKASRSFANNRARTYSRDDLALTWCQVAMSTNFRAMAAAIRCMSRDEIIRDLHDEMRAGIGGNGVRAAYIAERLARLRDRKLVAMLRADLGEYDVIGRAA